MTTATSDASLTSPLHDRHVALGAKMADFGGWEMPIEYPGGGVVAEHTAVREARRRLRREPPRQGRGHRSGRGGLRQRLPDQRPAAGSRPGQAQYTLCCDDGRRRRRRPHRLPAQSDDDVFLIPNAANTAEVVAGCRPPRRRASPSTNLHRDYGVIAVQGTRATRCSSALGLPTGHDYMSFVEADWQGRPVIVCRTGYTGERGYELRARAGTTRRRSGTPSSRRCAPFGGRPCGLGARDTLRTEMGYPLHGQDLSLDITPVQARAGWAVGWKKEAFWGREALEAERAAGPAASHARPAR